MVRCKTFSAVDHLDVSRAVREATDALNVWLDDTGYRAVDAVCTSTGFSFVVVVSYDDQPESVSPDMHALLLFLARAIASRSLPASADATALLPADGDERK
jgi:hypothetical protein